LRLLFLAGWLLAGAPAVGSAQGLTTAAVRGTVRLADDSSADGARVVVRHQGTGFVVEGEVRRGRFQVQGLVPGGPYTITVRRIGMVARRWEGVFLRLGEPLELTVSLDPAPLQLDSMVIVAQPARAASRSHGGTAATLSDSLVHRLPSLNRDIYDFLSLIPQISTRTGFTDGISGGGVGFRFNHFLTNGVSERSLGGGQPPEFAGGKSLPLEAVKEYQVLLAPFDVRYGDFAGAMINTVTRAGTNRFEASLFGQNRSDEFARGGESGASPYQRWQYGLSFSGPIVRNRAQFLAASELVHHTAPMTGPFVGQPAAAVPGVPVDPSDLARLVNLLGSYQLEAGSGGAVPNRNELRNLFLRLDGSVPEIGSRAVVWLNAADNETREFSRAPSGTFALSSHQADQVFEPRTVAFQLYTVLPGLGGGSNELSLSRRSISFGSRSHALQPIVNVALPDPTGGHTTVIAGTPAQAQGGGMQSRNVNLRDDLAFPLGRSHVVSLGFEAEWFRLEAPGVPNALGTWTFASLDSLEDGLAERYELALDFGSADVPLTGNQVAAWIGDSWRPGAGFSLTAGLRAEFLQVGDPPPYNRLVDSLFGRRTDQLPGRRMHLSPRLGFTWDRSGTGRDLLRGGVGVFTGRPPLAWYHVPLQSYGIGIGTLRCGTEAGDHGLPPPFDRDAPVACLEGEGLDRPPPGNVELVDPDLRLARTLRGVLAWERELPGGLVGTLEALLTHSLSDFGFVNLNLAGPVRTDSMGRVIYGTFEASGRARPARITDSLPGVIELRNVSGNHSVQLAASVAREFSEGFSLLASYTWSRVRDVQTPLRVYNRGSVNWGSRAISGRHDDLTPGISLNDVPHRVALAGTWRAPWRRWTTELSLMYVGESGSPFTWIAYGTGGRGDLNADGAMNDPVYIPRDAFDEGEITFTGVAGPEDDNSPEAVAFRENAQRMAFEQFIGLNPCLRRQRGRILERNSCREPWAQTTAASVRQAIPIGNRVLEARLDVFNLLNLLHHGWGLRRTARSSGLDPGLLEHVAQTVGAAGQQPVFRFSKTDGSWNVDRVASAYQLQLGLRFQF
jgi:hypothetical protein